MNLETKQLTLNTGQKVWYEYDHDGDLLELIFRQADASCAVELTESIILRFDWATNEPLSLSFISFSKLVRPTPYGQLYFQLLNDEWPDEIQGKILTMLQFSALNEFLGLSSYVPAYLHDIIPTTTIKSSYLTTLAA